MKIVIRILFLVLCDSLSAQDSVLLHIPAGSQLADVVGPERMFRFKDFKNGRVFFKDNTGSAGKLNFNFFNGEVQFIASNGDTLAIAKDQMLNIKRLTIDTATFVYDKGYLQVILENQNGMLAKKQQYYVLRRDKIGGYGMASSSSSIDSYTSFIAGRDARQQTLSVREDVTLQLKTDYFIATGYSSFLPVNRKNLDKIFFKKRNELDAYLSKNQIDFNNEKDVKALFISLTNSLP